MAFGRPRTSASSSYGVTEFWLWWKSGGEAQMTDALDAGNLRLVASELSKRVRAVSKNLDWETAEGSASRHRLIVSAGGVSDLRPLAQRWMRAAPAANVDWEFFGSRQRLAIADIERIQILGRSVDIEQSTFVAKVDSQLRRVDITCYNPEYARMKFQAAMHVTVLTLDWILGEEDVER